MKKLRLSNRGLERIVKNHRRRNGGLVKPVKLGRKLYGRQARKHADCLIAIKITDELAGRGIFI